MRDASHTSKGPNQTHQVAFSLGKICLRAGVIAILSASIGYWAGGKVRSGADSTSTSLNTQPGKSSDGTAGGISTRNASAFKLPAEIEAIVTHGSVKEAMMRALDNSDPVAKSAAFSLVLSSLTAANAHEAKAAMIESTLKTGRTADHEWGLMLGKLGELLGENAMAPMAGINDGERAITMRGWAKANPAASLNYISLQAAEVQNSLKSAWLAGVCRTDTPRAFSAFLSDPQFSGCQSGALIGEAVQSLGIDGAQRALQSAIDSSPEEATTSAGFQNLFTDLANAMLHQSWTSGTPEKTCAWLEQQKDASYLTPEILRHAAYNYAWEADPEQALDWTLRMHPPDANGRVPAASGVLDAVLEQSGQLARMSDAALEQLLIATASAKRFEITAGKIDATSPEQAQRLRELAKKHAKVSPQ